MRTLQDREIITSLDPKALYDMVMKVTNNPKEAEGVVMDVVLAKMRNNHPGL